MELVPIIYTVLKIVAVLAVLAISLSYISYRTKQKRREIYATTQKVSQPVIVSTKSIKKISHIQTKKSISPSRIEKPEIRSGKIIDIRPKPINKVDEFPKKYVKKENTNSKRITILKNLDTSNISDPSKIKKHTTQKEKTKIVTEETQLSSLGDKILDKYDEEDRNKMYTFNVKKKEDPNKKAD